MDSQPQISPEQLISEFLTSYQTSGIYLREPVDQLAGLATSEDPETVKAATGAIFASLVEALADSFAPSAVLLYNRLFAQMIQYCRQTTAGKPLDEALAKFALHTESQLLTRAEQLRYIRKFDRSETDKRKVRLAVVLSRITVGADVAITSVIISRLKREFVNAEIALIGNLKAAELFGGDNRLRLSEIKYRRAGTLTERLLSWLDVLQGVEALINGLSREEYVIVDPDSRLLQLGLLPLSGAENVYANPSAKAQIFDDYIFFPSREFGNRTAHSLSQLTSDWLNKVFGGREQAYPELHLKPDDLEMGKAIVKQFREQNVRPVVSINFGVGENPKKRFSDEFEKQVIVKLLQSGAKIIFDKGAGDAEFQRADALTHEAARVIYQNRNTRVRELNEERIARLTSADLTDADMLVWRGRIGLLAGLIGASDLYIGYDSAGQHIAAALGVACVDVFAGYTSERMLERWQPTGKAPSRVVAVDNLNQVADWQAVLSEVLQCANELLENRINV